MREMNISMPRSTQQSSGSSRVTEAVQKALRSQSLSSSSSQKAVGQGKPHDPAPSRRQYRLTRLWLRPNVRFFIKRVVPVLMIIAACVIWFSSEERRNAFVNLFTQLRAQIVMRPEFMLSELNISNVDTALETEIMEIINIDLPVSSFDVDLYTIQKQIEDFDAVFAADVKIEKGGLLSINVTPKEPKVLWRTQQGLYLLDENGYRIREVSDRNENPTLPILLDTGAQRSVSEALAIWEAARPIQAQIAGLVRVGERRWDIVLANGKRILLPEKGAVAAISQVLVLDQSQNVLSRNVSHIDMRNLARPTLRVKQELTLQTVKSPEVQVQP